MGSVFLDEYEATLHRILHCPDAWTEVSPNQRRFLFRRFPFAVLYTHTSSEIIVTAVLDLRMDPETLKTRQYRL
ncbi:MAG TPA: type II toxin-antitoxin system RelE/ParE family toxin [Kiritimatiellia bacterium]|nr:type II toxin-antitoxin system RelE/ParE family toxin [Kiritimatiellia bacterium]